MSETELGAEETTDEPGAEGTGPGREAVASLQGEALADILSEAWSNRGWDTDVVPEDDGTYLVAGDQGNGTRGLILVVPGDGQVPGKRLQQYASLVEKKSVDVRVVATQGGFTDDAERIANVNDVHLLGTEEILETIATEGLMDTLEAYASDAGGGGGGVLAALPVPGIGLPSGLPKPSLGGKGLKSVFLVVLIVSSLLAGFAGGAFLTPGSGVALPAAIGLGGGGADVAVASLSTAEPGDAGLTVQWNARTTSQVVVEGDAFEPPADSEFLVVQLVVTNTGDDRVPVRANDVLVNANGTRYEHQPLGDHRTFEMAALEPGEAATGWVVFAIPDDVADVVLVPDVEAAGGSVTFVRSPDLAINGTA